MSSRISIVRDSIVRIVRMLTEKKVQVTQRGATAYVTYNHDGTPRVVNIPHIPEDADEDLLVATQGFLDHEVAHVLFTDYAAIKLANEQGFASLHNIIEDSFIERKMAAAFAGSAHNLSSVGAYFLKNYTDTRLATLKAGDPAIEGLLIVPAIRAWAGQKVFQDYMNDGDKWSRIEKIVTRLKPIIHRVEAVTSSMDAANLARDMKKLLEIPDEEMRSAAPPPRTSKSSGSKPKERKAGERPAKRPKRSEEDDDVSAEGAEDEDSSEVSRAPGDPDDSSAESSVSEYAEPSEDGAAAPAEDLPEDDEEDDGLSASSEDDYDDDEEDDEEDDPTAGESPSMDFGSSEGPSGGGGAVKASGDDLYSAIEKEISKDFDEELSKLITAKASKDIEKSPYKIYTTDLDVIAPLVIKEGHFKDVYMKSMQESIDHMVGPLQKDFERAIASKSATTWSGGHRTGRLHAAALSRISTGDDRVFRRKHINNGKDVAVSLLVDCSGSMACSGKIKAAAYAAYALASVLDRMNIPCEVLGFTTKGNMPREMFAEESTHGFRYARTQPLYIPILKGFSERLNSDNKKRFAMLPEANWLNENVDGESVAIAAKRLSARREARKVLFVFSDGSPACPGDYAALTKHLKSTVREVEQSGIEVMGIGIADNNAAKYYSKHVLLTNISDLPTTVISQIKKVLMK